MMVQTHKVKLQKMRIVTRAATKRPNPELIFIRHSCGRTLSCGRSNIEEEIEKSQQNAKDLKRLHVEQKFYF